MREALLILLCLSASLNCNASDSGKFYQVFDVTCREYLRDRSSDATTLPHVAWISGYISAFNRQTADTYDIAGGRTPNQFAPWMDRWCQANPEKPLSKAMEVLTTELWAARVRARRK